jgi:hypothetical protein
MKDIEVGEYVRTKDGIIDKIERFSVGCCAWYCENGMCIDECNCMGTHLEDIAKHSKQLIDIIEVGDIVKDKNNKYEVAFVKDDKIYCNDYNLDDSLITLREQDIKEILAREQFEANCYKVGGEKC